MLSRARALRLAGRLGGKQRLIEGRVGVRRDFIVGCFGRRGFGVFGVHGCDSGLVLVYLGALLQFGLQG